MDIIVEEYRFSSEALQVELGISRLKPYSPGDHDLNNSYFEIYVGAERTEPIFTADNFAELLAFLQENHCGVGENAKDLVRLHWSDNTNRL